MSRDEELINSLKSIQTFLLTVGESHWSSKLNDIIEEAKLRDPLPVRKIRNLFGGMGSLSDLIIAKISGHAIETEDEKSANKQLELLCSKTFSLLEQLRR